MFALHGKAALVTGAAAGIGAACAAALARAGARVTLTDIDAAQGEATAAAIGANFRAQDVTDEAAWPEVVAAAVAEHGRLDIVVANAGIAIFGPLVTMSLADWRRQTAVNLDGVFLTIKHTVPALRRAGGRLDRADVLGRRAARLGDARRL